MKRCYLSLIALLLSVALAALNPAFADQAQTTSPPASTSASSTQPQAAKPTSTSKKHKYISHKKIISKKTTKTQTAHTISHKATNKATAASSKSKTKTINPKTTSTVKPSLSKTTSTKHVSTQAPTKTLASKPKPVSSTKKLTSTSPHHYTHRAAHSLHHLQSTSAARHQVATSNLKQSNLASDDYESDNDVISRLQQGNNEDMVPNNFNETLHERLLEDRYAAGQTAKAQIGTPYQWGGEAPGDGFDCSGLSQFVYQQEGISIPRTALEQYNSLTPVKSPQEGDLVFFRTHANSRQVSHVGIYIGDGYFVDSPRTGEAVRVDRLDNPYWKKAYAGARRVLTPRKVEAQQIAQKAPSKPENPVVAQTQTAPVTPATTNTPAPAEEDTNQVALNNNSPT